MLLRAIAPLIFLFGLAVVLAGCGNPTDDQATQAEPEATTGDVAALPDETSEGEGEEAEPEGYSTLPPQSQPSPDGAASRRGGPTQEVGAGVRGDVGMFYDALDRDGAWVEHPDYSYVWIPTRMGAGWRPYQDGRWIWTDDYGWYWESEEPFAWAVYHYGRWDYDPDYGWFWVPGDTWAPAWVTWRYGGDTVGWAPIAPDRPGFATGMPRRYAPPIAESWVFVEARNFGDDDLAPYVFPASRIGPSLEIAANVGRPRFEGDRVFNPGAPRDDMQRFMRRPIPTRVIVYVGSEGDMFDDVSDRRVGIYRPVIVGAKDGRPPRRLGDVGQSGRVMIRDYAGPGPSGRYDAPSAALLDVLDRGERQRLMQARQNAKQAAVDARIDQLEQERAALIEEKRKEAKRLEAKLEKARQEAKAERKRNREIVREQKRERAAEIKREMPADGTPPQPAQAETPAPQAPVLEAQPQAAPAAKQADLPGGQGAPAVEAPQSAPPPAGEANDALVRQPAAKKKEAVAKPDAVEQAPEAGLSPEAVPPEPGAAGAMDEAPRKRKPPKRDAATAEQPPVASPPPQANPADAMVPPQDAPPIDRGGREETASPPSVAPSEAVMEPAPAAPAPPQESAAPATDPSAGVPADQTDGPAKRRKRAAPDGAADVAPAPEAAAPPVTGQVPQEAPAEVQ